MLARKGERSDYFEFNRFLGKYGLDYFTMPTARKLVLEICEDYARFTKGAYLNTVLCTPDGLPNDYYWNIPYIKTRKGTMSKEEYLDRELALLKKTLKNFPHSS